MKLTEIKTFIKNMFCYQRDLIKTKLFLKEHNITNYRINKDLTVDVFESVNLSFKKLTEIPVQFGIIDGDFSCAFNELYYLKGMPRRVHGFFDCRCNKLQTLEHCPTVVNGSFNCSRNCLSNLDYGPKKVGKDFDCSHNRLDSLIGVPSTINGNFNCFYNRLKDLSGGPLFCYGNYICQDNPITSLACHPTQVDGDFNCLETKIETMEEFNTKVKGNFILSGYIIPEYEHEYSYLSDQKALKITGERLQYLQDKWNLRLELEKNLPIINTEKTKRAKI